jgi:plasmid maintenance system antidote protein VapI
MRERSALGRFRVNVSSLSTIRASAELSCSERDRLHRKAALKARRGVSADTALLFEALTGWDAQIWLTLQAKWDLWHAPSSEGAAAQSEGTPKDRLKILLERHEHPYLCR